jgi:predicted Zn-dependent peptidase
MKQYVGREGRRLALIPGPEGSPAAIAVRIAAGSKEDPPGMRGMAHLVEHMLFRGNQNRTQDELHQTFESMDCHHNASTGWDETMYHLLLPTATLAGVEECLRLLNDMIMHPNFTAETLALEKQIVENEVTAHSEEMMDELIASIFAEPVGDLGGTRASLRNITLKAVNKWHATHYLSSKMTVGIVAPQRVVDALGAQRKMKQWTIEERHATALRPVKDNRIRIVKRHSSAKMAHIGISIELGAVKTGTDVILYRALEQFLRDRLYVIIRRDAGCAYTPQVFLELVGSRAFLFVAYKTPIGRVKECGKVGLGAVQHMSHLVAEATPGSIKAAMLHAARASTTPLNLALEGSRGVDVAKDFAGMKTGFQALKLRMASPPIRAVAFVPQRRVSRGHGD